MIKFEMRLIPLKCPRQVMSRYDSTGAYDAEAYIIMSIRRQLNTLA